MTRVLFLAATLAAGPAAHLAAETVQIGVFGLFHPRLIRLRPAPGARLRLALDDRHFTLEAASATFSVGADCLVVQKDGLRLQSRVSRMLTPSHFVLEVPGRIEREFFGALRLERSGDELLAVVEMDLETATASAVSAEADLDWPAAALAAQAVASRSYYAAGGRHRGFDFCDTTHCQHLREPPAPDAVFSLATARTRGQTLRYDGLPLRALFSQSCGGRTKTAAEVGMSSESYPYFSRACGEQPERWRRRYSLVLTEALNRRPRNEAERLRFVRKMGWDALPSNAYTVSQEGNESVFEGSGRGHGLGLCQRGAVAAARRGADWREILQRYFPNTVVEPHAVNERER